MSLPQKTWDRDHNAPKRSFREVHKSAASIPPKLGLARDAIDLPCAGSSSVLPLRAFNSMCFLGAYMPLKVESRHLPWYLP